MPLGLPAGATRVVDRLYADFLMPSRLGAYRALLELALQEGYDVRGVGDFALAPPETAGPKTLILRHDVDTDPGTAARMWAADRSLGVRTSYFFRLSTFDVVLIQQIADGGGEVSYHYEELTTVVKRRGARTRDEAAQWLPEARDEFAANLARLRRQTGLPMRVVASHGDFVNRRLDIANWEILADQGLRARLGSTWRPTTRRSSTASPKSSATRTRRIRASGGRSTRRLRSAPATRSSTPSCTRVTGAPRRS